LSLNYVPKRGKCLHRMFRIIVVPRHAIIAKESEELLPILLKALLALRGHFALPLLVEKPPVKPLHFAKMLIEEVFLQSMAINGIHNLLEQCAELLYYLPQFIVVGFFNISSFTSRMRWIKHFCCGQSIESYAG
jgi:hypothetical protein